MIQFRILALTALALVSVVPMVKPTPPTLHSQLFSQNEHVVTRHLARAEVRVPRAECDAPGTANTIDKEGPLTNMYGVVVSRNDSLDEAALSTGRCPPPRSSGWPRPVRIIEHNDVTTFDALTPAACPYGQDTVSWMKHRHHGAGCDDVRLDQKRHAEEHQNASAEGQKGMHVSEQDRTRVLRRWQRLRSSIADREPPHHPGK